MSDDAVPLFVTFDEYLRLEELAQYRHEYVGGTIVAMAGATRAHNRMAARLVRLFGPSADKAGCDVLGSDMKVAIDPYSVYYPDVVVTCDRDDNDELIVRHPCLIVEVLSKSTASIDRREKRIAYQSVPSIECYLVVDPDFVNIEAHLRNTSGAFDGWDHLQLGHGSVLTLPCLAVDLDVTELYRSLDISDTPPPPPSPFAIPERP
jgi:Uma2 family endonuclease